MVAIQRQHLEASPMRRFLMSVCCLAVAALSACGAKEDRAAISRDLQNRGTTDLLQEASKDHYTAPADGRLTEKQVQMYLKVRDHEKQIALVARKELEQHSNNAKAAGEKSLSGMMEGFKGVGSLADLATADIRAARDLGYNSQEYLWVKGQILSASAAAMTEKFTQSMHVQLAATTAEMKKAMAEAKDDTTRQMYAQMVATYEKSTAAEKAEQERKAQTEPALAYNRQLLSKYENALNAYTTELSKYENKEGETKKAMDQWQKDLEKAGKTQ
jgi:hypothetical protein